MSLSEVRDLDRWPRPRPLPGLGAKSAPSRFPKAEKSPRNVLDPLPRRFVEAGFRDLLQVGAGTEEHLRGVLVDTLDHPGGLLRAQVIYGLMRAHGEAAQPALELAIAVEYFHTASLLLDDLPAMDDAVERRGRPCPHRVYGEGAAILGSLALITRAYDLLWRVLGPLPAECQQTAARLVDDCLGVAGILNGQSKDLFFRGGAVEARQVAEGKTVTLVRLTLVLPALVAGCDAGELARLEGLALTWGLGYQALDDLKDQMMSGQEAGKSTGRDRLLGRPNLAQALGVRQAAAQVNRLLDEGREIIAGLSNQADAILWRPLERLQEVLENECREMEERLAAA